MTYMQTITKDQLDIPHEVRDALQWPKGKVKVKIEPIENGFKVERVSTTQSPKKKLTQKEAEEIWADMKRISKLGEKDINLTEFLRHDRDTHL